MTAKQNGERPKATRRLVTPLASLPHPTTPNLTKPCLAVLSRDTLSEDCIDWRVANCTTNYQRFLDGFGFINRSSAFSGSSVMIRTSSLRPGFPRFFLGFAFRLTGISLMIHYAPPRLGSPPDGDRTRKTGVSHPIANRACLPIPAPGAKRATVCGADCQAKHPRTMVAPRRIRTHPPLCVSGTQP